MPLKSRRWVRVRHVAGTFASLLIASLTATAATPAPSASPLAGPPQFTYETWTHTFADPLANHKVLMITLVEESKDPESRRVFGRSADSISRFSLTDDGKTWFESENVLGHKAGDGARRVPPESFPRLNALLAALPDDAGLLPPPERRVMLQFRVNGKPITRVYDRATLSDDLLELFRLSNSFLGSWVPTFAPVEKVQAGDVELFGLLTLTPDGTKLISMLNHRPPRLWDSTTHQSIGEIALSPADPQIAFSADGQFVALHSIDYCDLFEFKTWRLVKTFVAPREGENTPALHAPQFTSDGKFLLLRKGDTELRAFDTTTWQLAPLPAAVPANAAAYSPSPDGKRAIVQLPNGQLSLWDPQQQKVVAPLYTGSRRWLASFSPNHELVAVAYLPKENAGVGRAIHIQLFNAASGAPLRDLYPNNYADAQSVDAFAWTPDSRTLLAATDRVVAAFNVSTGRHVGQFDCRQKIFSLALLPGNRQFATLSEDGWLRYYDLDAAITTMNAIGPAAPSPATQRR